MRPGFRVAAWLLGVVCLGSVLVVLLHGWGPKATPDTQPAAPESQPLVRPTAPPKTEPPKEAAAATVRNEAANSSVSAKSPVVSRPAQPAQLPLQAEPSPLTRQLVSRLCPLDPAAGPITAERAAEWKQNLQQLVQQGASAVPAIREFLAKNTDIDFGANGRQALGYASARAALFDALVQIGGSEAVAATAGALQTTADPHEIATLAQNLDRLDPQQHQQEAIAAARAALAMAAEGKLPAKDVAPLFEVFQKYGDASVVSDLQNAASKWNYYAMIALAQLPEGAGIPSLIQTAQGQGGAAQAGRNAALEMVAQVAAQSPEARAALVELARQDKLSSYNWATLEPILAGSQTHFQDSAYDGTGSTVNPTDVKGTHLVFGNQNFYTAPALDSLTAERVTQQVALIDELLSVAANPTAVQTLQRSKETLLKRFMPVAAKPGG